MNDKKAKQWHTLYFVIFFNNNNNSNHDDDDVDDDDVTYVAQIRTSRKCGITCQSRTEMFSVKMRRLSET